MVFSVCREEGESKDKRLFLRTLGEELKGFVLVLFCDMNRLTVGVFHPMPTRITGAVIELFRGEFPAMPLADLTNPITVITQQAGVGFIPQGAESVESSVAVAGHPLAG